MNAHEWNPELIMSQGSETKTLLSCSYKKYEEDYIADI